tara:strand:- start:1256 stop:1585 length:330 start_codon:yes stop_codon:yes gene_type:complete
MFIYSGFSKMNNFHKKVDTLQGKTKLPHFINVLGMMGVMILEVVGSIIMILHFFRNNIVPTSLIKTTSKLFILFLIVVTWLYHPPWDKKIPFLSNLTTLSGLLIIDSLI